MEVKKILYSSFDEWRNDTMQALGMLCYASYLFFNSIIYLFLNAIIVAIASAFFYVWKTVRDFRKREPVAFFVVFIVFALMAFGWLITYVQMQGKIVRAEDMLDSILYKTSIPMVR